MKKTALAVSVLVLLFLALAGTAEDESGLPPTGFFNTTQPATSLLGEDVGRYGELFEPGEDVNWQYYVPPNYSPENAPGLLVYISPTQSGAMPKEWRSIMDKHNMIWIGADKSGNRSRVPRRILLSLLGVELTRRDYVIDESRVYLSGFSGGARVASMAAMDYPQTFRGGLFFCGADLWDLESSPNMEIIRENRYVLVTGVLDQALEPVKRTYRGYRKAGIDNTKLMIIRDMGHSTPRKSDFARAITFLNERPPAD